MQFSIMSIKKFVQLIEYENSPVLKKINEIKDREGMKFATEVLRFCINEVHRKYQEK